VIAIDHPELVLAAQGFEDRRSHLTGSDHENLHRDAKVIARRSRMRC